jgi:predicted transcriptional regulator
MATKRKKLTLLEKVKIIHKVENNPNMPATEIARKFNLPPSSLFCIMKKKQSIVDEEVKCGGEANKRNCVYLIQNICDYEKACLLLDLCRNSLF